MWWIIRVGICIRIGKLWKSAYSGLRTARTAHLVLALYESLILGLHIAAAGPQPLHRRCRTNGNRLRARTETACAYGRNRFRARPGQLARTGRARTGTACAYGLRQGRVRVGPAAAAAGVGRQRLPPAPAYRAHPESAPLQCVTVCNQRASAAAA